MRLVYADPHAYCLMMYTDLASDGPITHALVRQSQRLRCLDLVGLPSHGLRCEVFLTRAAAKTLTPSAILSALQHTCRLMTLGTCNAHSFRPISQCRVLRT